MREREGSCMPSCLEKVSRDWTRATLLRSPNVFMDLWMHPSNGGNVLLPFWLA
jgi:hypothetical protein